MNRREISRAGLMLIALSTPTRGLGAAAAAPVPAPTAAAAPALETDAPPLAESRYRLGRKLYAEGDHAGAVREFASALDIFPTSAKLAFNLGRSCERINDTECALRAYRLYLANAPDAPDRADMDRLIAGLERRLEEALPIVTVTSEPSGAAIRLDDGPIESVVTPTTLRVQPGAHIFRLRLGAGPEATRPVSLTRGATTTVHVAFNIAPRPASTAGLDASAPRTELVPVSPWVAYGLLGASAAAVGVGGYFFWRAGETADAAEGLGRTPTELKRHAALEDEHGTQVTVALASTAMGALLGLGGVVFLYIAQPTRGLALSVTPGGALLLGHF